MSNRLVAVLIVAILTVSGYQATAWLIDIEKVLSLVVPVAEANTPSTNLQSSNVPDSKRSSVGALRSPSAHSRADRTCYYCHGFHGDKYKYNEGLPSASILARTSENLENSPPISMGLSSPLDTRKLVSKSNTQELSIPGSHDNR